MSFPPLLSHFRFRSCPPTRSGWRRVKLVRISPHLNSKQQLIRCYVRELRLPAWTGPNWDAFEESLRALEGLPRPVHVRIWHTGCPFLNSPADLQTYCEILNDAVEIPSEAGVDFEILFPKSDREAMIRALSGDPSV